MKAIWIEREAKSFRDLFGARYVVVHYNGSKVERKSAQDHSHPWAEVVVEASAEGYELVKLPAELEPLVVGSKRRYVYVKGEDDDIDIRGFGLDDETGEG